MPVKRRESHGFISSWVRQAWYDQKAKMVEVEFVDGVRWLYLEVSPSTWRDFISSRSAGHFIRTTLERHPNHRR